MGTSRYRAEESGRLPETTTPEVGGMRLPSGRLVSPDPNFVARRSLKQQNPVLWISNEPVRDVGSICRQIAATFPVHGHWPLVLESLPSDDHRPWLAGEFDPTASTSPDRYEPEDVLTEWWAYALPVEEEEEEAFEFIAPFGPEFPGLAPASRSPVNPNALDLVTSTLSGRLGLVACAQPADAISTVGWQGPANYHTDMGPLSAVLRSWEDRFGAYVVGVGFDTLALAVQRPPGDLESAQAIAVEHFATCPDNIYQGFGAIRAYAEMLIGNSVWMFWWD